MELQLHLLVCYVWIQLIKSTFCFSNSAIQMNVCDMIAGSLCKTVTYKEYFNVSVPHAIIKSASLVHVVLVIMYFWQGRNKNGF